MSETWEVRLWAKVERSDEGCWEWREGCARTSDGYGQFWLDGRMRLAHRVVWELLIGPIPEGLDLDHLCRVRACVNPSHLEPVTNGMNQSRGEKSYAMRALCRRGLHDITDSANIIMQNTGRRTCAPCLRERHREACRRYRVRRSSEAVAAYILGDS